MTLCKVSSTGDAYHLRERTNAGTECELTVFTNCANRTIFSEELQNRLNIVGKSNVFSCTRGLTETKYH